MRSVEWLAFAAIAAWAAWNWWRWRLAVRELKETAEELPGLQAMADRIQQRLDDYQRLSAIYRESLGRRDEAAGREPPSGRDAASQEGGPGWP